MSINCKVFSITIPIKILDKYLKNNSEITIAYFRHRGIPYKLVGRFEKDER